MTASIDGHKDRFGSSRPVESCRSPRPPTTPPPPTCLGSSGPRHQAQGRDRPGPRRAPRGLRRPQGLAPAAPRRDHRGPLHRGAAHGELGLEGVRRGKPTGPPRPMRPLPDPLTWWSGTSRRPGRTSCGSRTSPRWRPGPASSLWPWSSTPSAASWSAGRPRGRCAPTWPWTPSRWPPGVAAAAWMAWYTIPTGAVPVDPLHRAAGRGRGGHLGGLPRGLVRHSVQHCR
jgi:hypothetical protein